MMDRDEISEDMISGDAGCICTRFEDGVEGPGSDRRRPFCLVRVGIGGGVDMSMAPSVKGVRDP